MCFACVRGPERRQSRFWHEGPAPTLGIRNATASGRLAPEAEIAPSQPLRRQSKGLGLIAHGAWRPAASPSRKWRDPWQWTGVRVVLLWLGLVGARCGAPTPSRKRRARSSRPASRSSTNHPFACFISKALRSRFGPFVRRPKTIGRHRDGIIQPFGWASIEASPKDSTTRSGLSPAAPTASGQPRRHSG